MPKCLPPHGPSVEEHEEQEAFEQVLFKFAGVAPNQSLARNQSTRNNNTNEFCYGLNGSSGKAVHVGGEPVVRIVVLSGVENQFQKMICLTLTGKVLMRSIDGRKSPRAKPDLFIVEYGRPPDIINV